MASTLDTIATGARVAIIRVRSLGDCVLTTPALELLHRHRPDLELGVVVEDRFRGVFEHHPAVAEILEPTVVAVRAFRPQMVINFHGGTRSAVLTLSCGARVRAGFAHHAGAQAYNVRIPRAQEILGEERTVHTAEHLASAMFYLGVPQSEIPRASLFAPEGRPEDGVYAVLHPFASAPGKAWPAARFVETASRLGMRAVVLAGPHDDVRPFEAFRVYRNAPLEQVKQLLRGAALFIGNDSGPAHVAASFDIPVVVLFGTSDPVIWAPWRAPNRILTSPEGLASIPVEACLNASAELGVRA
ncbi:MAG TPA: glycosyltransferase family 9 protein [Bryobacteraceae bacterium]|jgi:ADP-heptose:LPS heptosyltransferase